MGLWVRYWDGAGLSGLFRGVTTCFFDGAAAVNPPLEQSEGCARVGEAGGGLIAVPFGGVGRHGESQLPAFWVRPELHSSLGLFFFSRRLPRREAKDAAIVLG